MDMQNKTILDTFTIESIPDLDVVTLGALELLSNAQIPLVDFSQFKRPLVVGSGNAAVTGKLLFADVDAVFADESSYVEKLNSIETIDGAVLISASGSKHAVEIANELKRRNLKTLLLTNNPKAPAIEIVGDSTAYVFPRNREPYTYNTSTYMGMILSKTCEQPADIHAFLINKVAPAIPENIAAYDAYYLMLPEKFNAVREMFATKFDELFGPVLMGRIFTEEQTKHAKTVITMDRELFISFGIDNNDYGLAQNRLVIPLPSDASYAAMMSIGYFVIGHIQRGKPAYFKDRVVDYTAEISKVFNQEIKPIVE